MARQQSHIKAVVAILAMISVCTTSGQSLIDRGPCDTWYPLGANGQNLSTFPYIARCSPTPDGTQIISTYACIMRYYW